MFHVLFKAYLFFWQNWGGAVLLVRTLCQIGHTFGKFWETLTLTPPIGLKVMLVFRISIELNLVRLPLNLDLYCP